jgi:hypothetical protein
VSERDRRRELRAQYENTRPEAGVYLIRNNRNGRAMLGSTSNLASLSNKLAFARATDMPGALDLRLRGAISEFGIDAFSLEVLDVLDTKPEMTSAQIRDDLATLEKLWREKLDPATLY